MQIKGIAMVVVAGCAIGMLTGCGVPQEEVNAMLAAKDAEHSQAIEALNLKLTDEESLRSTQEEKARQLQNQLREASVELTELKDGAEALESQVEAANSQVEQLESSLASAQRQISSANDRAAEAANGQAAAELEAQETQRRFEALIENLLKLNKIKPEDVGFPNLNGGEMGGMDDMGAMDDMGSGDAADTGSSDLEGLLDDMGNM